MKTFYKGFVIEKDETIETPLHYIRRQDGEKFRAYDGSMVCIESLQEKLPQVIEYIAAITE